MTTHMTPLHHAIRGCQQPDDVEIIEQEIVYRRFFTMRRYLLSHRLFNGNMGQMITRELLERGVAVAILLYDAKRDMVVLIEQFRIGALAAKGGAWLYEIVAGIVESGELSEEVARREAMEEAGCEVGRIEHICDFLVSPGGTSEQITLLCGEVDSSNIGGLHGLAEEGEDIRAFCVDFATAWQWLQNGEINSATPIIALQWLHMQRKRLQSEWKS